MNHDGSKDRHQPCAGRGCRPGGRRLQHINDAGADGAGRPIGDAERERAVGRAERERAIGSTIRGARIELAIAELTSEVWLSYRKHRGLMPDCSNSGPASSGFWMAERVKLW
ncbi:MAG: hypothetical protein ACHQXL_09060 [Candidatus Limnocylindrales bacterium]